MKEKNLYRNDLIRVYVTEQEKNLIKNNMKNAGLRTMTNYVRKMALTGHIIHIDFSSLKESLAETGKYVFELNKIGTNLNQIAYKLNQTDIVEEEDIKYLLSEFKRMQANYLNSQEILLKEIQNLVGSD